MGKMQDTSRAATSHQHLTWNVNAGEENNGEEQKVVELAQTVQFSLFIGTS